MRLFNEAEKHESALDQMKKIQSTLVALIEIVNDEDFEKKYQTITKKEMVDFAFEGAILKGLPDTSKAHIREILYKHVN